MKGICSLNRRKYYPKGKIIRSKDNQKGEIIRRNDYQKGQIIRRKGYLERYWALNSLHVQALARHSPGHGLPVLHHRDSTRGFQASACIFCSCIRAWCNRLGCFHIACTSPLLLPPSEEALFFHCYCYSSVCTWRAPNGVQNGGLPISMWGSHLSSGCCEQHTTRTTIVLAFWQIYDNSILMMFGTS
jgi:hypothetical protein